MFGIAEPEAQAMDPHQRILHLARIGAEPGSMCSWPIPFSSNKLLQLAKQLLRLEVVYESFWNGQQNKDIVEQNSHALQLQPPDNPTALSCAGELVEFQHRVLYRLRYDAGCWRAGILQTVGMLMKTGV